MSSRSFLRTGGDTAGALTIRKSSIGALTCLLIPTAIGLILRLIAIDSRGLWADEAWRVWAARLPDGGQVIEVAWAQPPSAPLYWIGLHFWVALFGHADTVVRVFSVVPSLATIVAAYLLGLEAGAKYTGIAASAFMAVSPLAVETGQEATMYAWAMLLVTLTLLMGLHLLHTGHGVTSYVLLGTLLLYTHYLGALVLILSASVGTLVIWRRSTRHASSLVTPQGWLRPHLWQLLLWFPWLLAMGVRLAQRWPEISQLKHPAQLAEIYGAAVKLSVSASAEASWDWRVVLLTTVLGLALFTLGLWLRPSADRQDIQYLGAIVLLFIVILVCTSLVTGAWLVNPRFFAIMLAPALVVLAAGFQHLFHAVFKSWRFTRTAAIIILTAWLCTQLAGVSAFYLQPVHGRDGLREIGAELNKNVIAGDVVASNHPLLLWSLAQYYTGKTTGLPASWDVRNGYPLLPPDQPKWVDDQLLALPLFVPQASRLWLLYLPDVDPDGRLLSSLSAHRKVLSSQGYPFARLYLFGPAPSASLLSWRQ